jgi:hypothetical protein
MRVEAELDAAVEAGGAEEVAPPEPPPAQAATSRPTIGRITTRRSDIRASIWEW